MENIGLYGELGFFHVMDLAGYDHVLFLIALALPFGYSLWKRVLWLATLFTIAHCFSLALAAFNIVSFDSGVIEFLIPITILLTAIFDLYLVRGVLDTGAAFKVHLLSTGIFGLIHGLGFSNYFRMLMSGESEKVGPLVGFALGIEFAQIVVLLFVMSITYLIVDRLKLEKIWVIRIIASAIVLIASLLMIRAWP
jgi:hypothetical protein